MPSQLSSIYLQIIVLMKLTWQKENFAQKTLQLDPPHCWGHHAQKVDTKANFHVILFVMINALI